MRRELLARLVEARAAKRPVALVRDLEGGEASLVVADEVVDGPDLGDDVLGALRESFRLDRSRTIEGPNGPLFLQIFNPPLRLVVVGAVHIAQPLVPMAALAGYDVTVVDPRRAFASDERFPGVRVSRAWPDEALEELGLDARSAVVTLTHDPKLDDPALDVALRSEAFYVAALGSRRTHGARLERLRAAGFVDGVLARIHGPAGLDIGAISPAEIAIAIMAEMTRALRKRDAV